MSVKFFTKYRIFNPIDYGISIGDLIHVICVGGGCGGVVAIYW